jgi:hypothetical protein
MNLGFLALEFQAKTIVLTCRPNGVALASYEWP